MQPYTAYFLNASGMVVDAQPLHAETAEEALDLARGRLDESTHSAIELWQLATRIATVARDE